MTTPRFTKTLEQMLTDNPTMLDDLVLDTAEDTQAFINMFKSYYRYYERAYDDDDVFNTRVHDYYTVWVSHYKKILAVYNEEIEILNGVIEKESFEGTTNDVRNEVREGRGTNNSTTDLSNTSTEEVKRTGTVNVSKTGEDSVKKYDYPNYSGAGTQTSQDKTEYGSNNLETRNTTDKDDRNLSSSSTFDGATTENSSYTTDNKISRETERTLSRVNQVEQRELYYKTVHNVMLEFVKKFSPCFLKIYY